MSKVTSQLWFFSDSHTLMFIIPGDKVTPSCYLVPWYKHRHEYNIWMMAATVAISKQILVVCEKGLLNGDVHTEKMRDNVQHLTDKTSFGPEWVFGRCKHTLLHFFCVTKKRQKR